MTDPAEKARLGATTRAGKEKGLTAAQLRAEWDGRLTPAERRAVAAAHTRAGPAKVPAVSPAAAVDHALGHCFERASVVPERHLLAEALRRGVGAVTVEAVAGEFAARPLLAREVAGQRLVTTPEVLGEEGRVVALARAGRGRFAALGDPDRPVARPWLNAGQRAAVRHVLGSRDRVTVVRGAAGTGKTTMMQEAVDGLRAAGREVVVLAPSAQASRGVLRGEGFAGADTVARFLADPRLRDAARDGVVWVDEAGLVGVPTMARLLAAADALGARVVLSGDRRQHGSVERGAALRLLEERAGVPVAEVTEVLRQTRAGYKRAVERLAAGDAAAGLAALDRLGWVREVPDADRYRVLAADYLAATRDRKPGGAARTALIVAPTHAEGAQVTAAVRAALKAAGGLADEREVRAWVPARLTEAERRDPARYRPGDLLQFHQHAPGHARGERLVVGDGTPPVAAAARFQLYRPAGLPVAVGDRLRVTANGKTKDGRHRLDNGDLLTVAGFTPAGDLVDARGWVVAADFGHLAHGYAVTSHASQGRTVDTVLLAQSAVSFPASGREQFYVSASRGREAVVVYTDDKAGLARAVGRADPRLTATELVGRPPTPPRRHLAALRRLAAFERAHAAPPPPERSPYREAVRDR